MKKPLKSGVHGHGHKIGSDDVNQYEIPKEANRIDQEARRTAKEDALPAIFFRQDFKTSNVVENESPTAPLRVVKRTWMVLTFLICSFPMYILTKHFNTSPKPNFNMTGFVST